jgi:hypothetical protein
VPTQQRLFVLSLVKRNAKFPSAGVTGPVADIWKKEKMMSKRKILSIILVFYVWLGCVM